MTDRQRLIDLLDNWGVGYRHAPSLDLKEEPDEGDVVIEAYLGNVEGYSGFYTVFEFNDDGTFRSVGIWE